MPPRSLKPCPRPGCGRLTRASYCDQHQAEFEADRAARRQRLHRDYNQGRDQVDRFYGSVPWKQLRALFLQQQPVCVECQRLGITTRATVADHTYPVRERPDLALDISNLRALCHACHNRVGRRVGRGGAGRKFPA